MTPPPWRSLLYVPAHVERFVGRAHERGADAIILDLEDSVPEAEKPAARAALAAAVPLVRSRGAGVIIRINRPLDLAVRDVEAAVIPGVDVLAVTKTEGPEHLRLMDELIGRIEAARGLAVGGIGVFAVIEDPGALSRAPAIAASPRVVMMGLGGEDYATALAGEPTEEVLLLPKQQVIQAARAHGVAPYGVIGTLAAFGDLPAYAAMVRRSVAFGFAGASCVHPAQVPVLNDAFSPGSDQVAEAQRIVAAAREAAQKGLGAVAVDGRMVDKPIVARAEALLARAARFPRP